MEKQKEGVSYRLSELEEKKIEHIGIFIDILSAIPALNWITAFLGGIFVPMWFFHRKINPFKKRPGRKIALWSLELIPGFSLVPTYYFNIQRIVLETREEDEKKSQPLIKKYIYSERNKGISNQKPRNNFNNRYKKVGSEDQKPDIKRSSYKDLRKKV